MRAIGIEKKKSVEKLATLEFAVIILLFAIYLLPSVSIGTTILLGILLVYSAYIALFDRKTSQTVVIMLLLISLLALAYTFLTDANSISRFVSNRMLKRFISKFFQYLSLYFPAMLFIHVSRKASAKQKNILMIVSLVLVAYVMCTTWIYLLEHPDATREWENFDEASQSNVANYYFIYAVPMIIAIVTACYVKLKNGVKYCSIALIVVGLVFLINAQYTLSVLISLIGVVFQIFRSIKKSSSRVFFALAIVLVSFFIPTLLEFAIENIKSEQMTIRLSELHDFLTGKGAGGYNLSSRLTLYWETLKAFFKSPIIGNRNLSFDGHATFLTVLSDTGILGGVPFYTLLCFVVCRINRMLREKKIQFAAVVLMFVLMGTTNPIHASKPLGLATWFIAPLMIETIFKEEGKL